MVGCGCEVCRSADPKDKRLRSSVLVEQGDTVFTIDCGPDFREQMLQHDVKQMDAVLFTHSHRDHTAGLDEVRAYNFLQRRDMPLYLTQDCLDILKQQFAYIFAENPYPGIPRVRPEMITKDQPFDIGGLTITPIEVMHYKMPVLGFRMGDFAYITDANYIAPEEMEKLKGVKVLVLNALRHEKHISHFTLSEAVELVQQLQVEQAWFTHISHQLGKHADINPNLPEGMQLAYDGLKITV